MDYEEDDDVSFAKWMSSFWGHSVTDDHGQESRAHRKHPARPFDERRASLPAKLSSIHMTRLNGSTRIPSTGHLKTSKELRKDEETNCYCHVKACRKSSNSNSHGASGPNSRSNSIQEFSESFERQLHFKNKRSVSLEPEGMKERREREKLRIPKNRFLKKLGEKKELKTELEEGENSVELALGKHKSKSPMK